MAKKNPMSKNTLSSRGARIVGALKQFADDLEAGVPIESKYTVRQVRTIPPPRHYSSSRVRAVRKLLGASQEVFAQLLAVSPMTVRSWEQGSREPSPMACRFLDEIRTLPAHFRSRIAASTVKSSPPGKDRKPVRSR